MPSARCFGWDAGAAQIVQQVFGVPCVPLTLTNPSYYHLDTAMCALPCGAVIYYPGAFAPAALEAIHDRVAPADRIALDPTDAAHFAANSVVVGRTVVLSSASAALCGALKGRGYTVVETALTAFQ